MLAEVASAGGGEADAELLGRGLVEAAGVEELASRQGAGAGQLAGEVLRRLLVGLEDAQPQARLHPLPAAVGVPQLDADAVGEELDGLAEADVVDLLDEGDHVAALAAAEAVVEAAGRVDVERRGLLVVERAQAAE